MPNGQGIPTKNNIICADCNDYLNTTTSFRIQEGVGTVSVRIYNNLIPSDVSTTIFISFGRPVIEHVLSTMCVSAVSDNITLMDCPRGEVSTVTLMGRNFAVKNQLMFGALDATVIRNTNPKFSANHTHIVFGLPPTETGTSIPLLLIQIGLYLYKTMPHLRPHSVPISLGGSLSPGGPKISYRQCPANADINTIDCKCYARYVIERNEGSLRDSDAYSRCHCGVYLLFAIGFMLEMGSVLSVRRELTALIPARRWKTLQVERKEVECD